MSRMEQRRRVTVKESYSRDRVVVLLVIRPAWRSRLFPYTTLFRSRRDDRRRALRILGLLPQVQFVGEIEPLAVELNRSEEHTPELQSPVHLVCRLVLEKKKSTHSPLKASNDRISTSGKQTTQ